MIWQQRFEQVLEARLKTIDERSRAIGPYFQHIGASPVEAAHLSIELLLTRFKRDEENK